MKSVPKPIRRSGLRLQMGMAYYGFLRKLLWLQNSKQFANSYEKDLLPYACFSHKTILRRKLKDVELWMQENKIVNLKLAAKKLNGIVIQPGQSFSFWKLVGQPTKGKGYLKGMVLQNGAFQAGTGGGLCQLSNLIFWMALHTPLTVTERHRHGYDVFPDSNRTQPFGSGATCFYPHGDLMLQNNTSDIYQLLVCVGETHLEGAWRVTTPPLHTYKIIEKNHKMQREYWGGHSRHNELYQQKFDLNGNLLEECMVVKNSTIMMYAPLLNCAR